MKPRLWPGQPHGDPDNRRPIDFGHRARLLEAIRREFGERSGAASGDASRLAPSWRDGRLKLLVTWRLLTFRRRHRELFLHRHSASRRAGEFELAAAELFADLPLATVEPCPEPGG